MSDSVNVRSFPMPLPVIATSPGEREMLHGQAMIKPTLELAAAALNGAVDESTADGAGLGLFTMICRHVDGHLFDADLTAEAAARRFGISTRKLYYLFEEIGGFALHVQEQRLRRARAALFDPSGERRSIADIASDHGFAHRSTFVAAFRRLFGMSPREMRQLGRDNAMPGDHERAEWARWIAGIR